MSLPETIFKTDKTGRQRILERGEPVRAISTAAKRAILEMLEAGATITEICASNGMPDRVTIWQARKTDQAFDTEFRAAQAKGAEAMLDLAKAHAVDEIESRDPDRVRCALMMMQITKEYAEKIAPREFGQLVKLAGDPNAPLQLNVVSYALPVSGALTPVDCENAQTLARDAVPAINDESGNTGTTESGTDQGVCDLARPEQASG